MLECASTSTCSTMWGVRVCAGVLSEADDFHLFWGVSKKHSLGLGIAFQALLTDTAPKYPLGRSLDFHLQRRAVADLPVAKKLHQLAVSLWDGFDSGRRSVWRVRNNKRIGNQLRSRETVEVSVRHRRSYG